MNDQKQTTITGYVFDRRDAELGGEAIVYINREMADMAAENCFYGTDFYHEMVLPIPPNWDAMTRVNRTRYLRVEALKQLERTTTA